LVLGNNSIQPSSGQENAETRFYFSIYLLYMCKSTNTDTMPTTAKQAPAQAQQRNLADFKMPAKKERETGESPRRARLAEARKVPPLCLLSWYKRTNTDVKGSW
jgi:hypothetical protein